MTRMMKIQRTYRVRFDAITIQGYWMDVQAKSYEKAEEKVQAYLDEIPANKKLDDPKLVADDASGMKIELEIWNVEEIDTSQEK